MVLWVSVEPGGSEELWMCFMNVDDAGSVIRGTMAEGNEGKGLRSVVLLISSLFLLIILLWGWMV